MMEDYSLQERPECFVPLTKGKQSSAAKPKGTGRPKELALQNTELPVAYPMGRVLNPSKVQDLQFVIPFMPRVPDQDWCKELIGRQKTLRVLLKDQVGTDADDANLQEDPDNPDDIIWDDVDVRPIA